MSKIQERLAKRQAAAIKRTAVQAPTAVVMPAAQTPSPPPEPMNPDKQYAGKGRGLFGADPETESMVFPTSTKTFGAGAVGAEGRPLSSSARQAITGTLDLAGLPGRNLATTPEYLKLLGSLMPGGKTPSDALEDVKKSIAMTEGSPDKKGLKKFGADIMRDPISALMMLMTGGGSVPGQVAKKTLTKALSEGSKKMIIPAIARQVGKSAESGEVRPAEQALEGVVETLAGGGGEVVGKLINVGGKKAGANLMKRVLKIKDTTAKLAGKDVEAGANKIANNIVKYKIESPSGGFSGMLKNSQKQISKEAAAANKELMKFAKQNPNATIDVDRLAYEFLDELESGAHINLATNEEAAAKFTSKLYEFLDKRGLGGDQPISKLPEIKRLINDISGAFKKGPYTDENVLKAEVGSTIYRKINNSLNEVVPNIKKHNMAMNELFTVQQALKEAMKRTGNNNFIGLTDVGLLTAGGTSGAGPWTIPLVALKKLMEKGRGASFLIKQARKSPTRGRVLAAQGAEEVGIDELSNFLGGLTGEQQ